MSEQLVFDINMSDCVGDSVAKHNYNLLSLDTNICNISSKFFRNENSYYTQFLDLSANINFFNGFADVFFDPARVNKATSATTYLSGYWNQFEFTITYPINQYDLNDAYKAPKNYIDQTTTNPTLVQLGLNLLNRSYPATNFLPRTKSNVVFLLYSSTGALTSTKTQSFSITNRIFNITNRKADVCLSAIKIGGFEVASNFTWINTFLMV